MDLLEAFLLANMENQLLSSKFKSNIEDLENALNHIKLSASSKRPEENYKFVFKRCLDFMKENFREINPLVKKKDFERKFYEHYFLQISKDNDLPLECFFDPKNSLSKCENSPKTINTHYVENISRSQEFIKEFTDYMNNQLIDENKKALDGKIEALMLKWEKNVNEAKDFEKAIKSIKEEVEKNKKAKLPWTIREIDEAIKSVKSLFNSTAIKK